MNRLLAFALFIGALVAWVPAPPAHAEPVVAAAPDLDTVAVDSSDYRAAQARYDNITTALTTATATITNTAVELTTLQTEDVRLTAELASATRVKKAATVAMVQARRGLRAMAVDAYVEGQPAPLDPTDLEAATNVLHRATLATAISDEQATRLGKASAEYERTSRLLATDLHARVKGRDRMGVVQTEHDQAVADAERLTRQQETQRLVLERARLTATVVGADFVLVALDAYWRAAAALASDDPSCGIPWWALAGVGRIESRHATSRGARLLWNGDTDRIIVGIPLDGTNNTQSIPDTDGGEFDGDTEYDRAVGPMQFIPSTWRRWARDGNGDRSSSPNNMYDAAYAAARYLCSGGPMQTDEEMRSGFFRYNHSEAYADAVLFYAKSYSRFPIGARQ